MKPHGWVKPRPDGLKARCGGPGFCLECREEARQALEAQKLRVVEYDINLGVVIKRDGEIIARLPRGEILRLYDENERMIKEGAAFPGNTALEKFMWLLEHQGGD